MASLSAFFANGSELPTATAPESSRTSAVSDSPSTLWKRSFCAIITLGGASPGWNHKSPCRGIGGGPSPGGLACCCWQRFARRRATVLNIRASLDPFGEHSVCCAVPGEVLDCK